MVDKLRLFNRVMNINRYLRRLFPLTYLDRGKENRKSKLFKHKVRSSKYRP